VNIKDYLATLTEDREDMAAARVDLLRVLEAKVCRDIQESLAELDLRRERRELLRTLKRRVATQILAEILVEVPPSRDMVDAMKYVTKSLPVFVEKTRAPSSNNPFEFRPDLISMPRIELPPVEYHEGGITSRIKR
jgi:flagellar biosynthesis regulator FlaF